jgi:phenylalanyl-tRNA synthetase beta chain
VIPAEHPGLAPGASGRIEWGGNAIGHIGRISLAVAQKLDLRTAPAAAELELSELLVGAQHVPQLTPLPRFPSVTRDLTFDVPDSLRFADLRKLVERANPANLEELRFVGTYRGKQLKSGQKSLTISLVFRAAGDTLTSQVVDAAIKQVIDTAAQASIELRI